MSVSIMKKKLNKKNCAMMYDCVYSLCFVVVDFFIQSYMRNPNQWTQLVLWTNTFDFFFKMLRKILLYFFLNKARRWLRMYARVTFFWAMTYYYLSLRDWIKDFCRRTLTYFILSLEFDLNFKLYILLVTYRFKGLISLNLFFT